MGGVVVKIMVPFWTPSIIWHRIFRVPKKGVIQPPISLTRFSLRICLVGEGVGLMCLLDVCFFQAHLGFRG